MAKVIQLLVWDNRLYALDDAGVIWRYRGDRMDWDGEIRPPEGARWERVAGP